ncbi:unnamed protein product [Allacma fusca]|uniref:Uncharacterized protein n=1 Tax=Allacma fusca TaxID=39272 RepID=A0A8J2JRD9_9HEXA|nr:unnamed protein product [Allacma fusca]
MQDFRDRFLLVLFLGIFGVLACVSYYYAKENNEHKTSRLECNIHQNRKLIPPRELAYREDIHEIIQLFKSINSTLSDVNRRIERLENEKKIHQTFRHVPRKFRRESKML